MNIGAYLKTKREELGLTQSDIGDFNKAYVSGVESNKRQISVNTLEKFAEAFGMQLNPELFVKKTIKKIEKEDTNDNELFLKVTNLLQSDKYYVSEWTNIKNNGDWVEIFYEPGFRDFKLMRLNKICEMNELGFHLMPHPTLIKVLVYRYKMDNKV